MFNHDSKNHEIYKKHLVLVIWIEKFSDSGNTSTYGTLKEVVLKK